jgi:hypothetical protein
MIPKLIEEKAKMTRETASELKRGHASLQERDRDTALHCFRNVLDENPGNAEALCALSDLYLKADLDVAQAEKYIEQALAENPGDISVILKGAQFAEGEDEWSRAQELYEKALVLDPDSIEAKAGIERITYLMSGTGGEMHDGTYIGNHSELQPTPLFSSPLKGKLISIANDFYRHIGRDVPGKAIIQWSPLIKLVMVITFLITPALMESSDEGRAVAALLWGVFSIGVVVLVILHRRKKKLVEDMRQHFIDETGFQIADPDKGVTELRRVLGATKAGFMIWLRVLTGWWYREESEKIEVGERIDLKKPSWWKFQEKRELRRGKRFTQMLQEVLNRHWFFHLRNPKTIDAWNQGQWSDDDRYIRHLILGEIVDDFDFRTEDEPESHLFKIVRVFWFIPGFCLGAPLFAIGFFLAMLGLPIGERLVDEIAPYVMFLKKPELKRGVQSLPLKDDLVVGSDLVTLRR